MNDFSQPIIYTIGLCTDDIPTPDPKDTIGSLRQDDIPVFSMFVCQTIG